MRRLAWVLGLLVLLGGGAVLVRAPAVRAPAPQRPAKPDIPRLQALATESCRCARSKTADRGKRACWAQFERQASRFDPAPYFSACDPISPKGFCFGDDLNACVVTEYAGVPDVSLCSQDEARTAMAAFEDARRRREAGDSTADPDKAFLAVSEALARGDRLAASAGDGGCAG